MPGDDRTAFEKELRAAILRGDDFAWRSLVARHGGLLRRVATESVPTGAEDLVQEAWMVALRRMKDFDPRRGRLDAWLAGIVRGLAANARRRPGELTLPEGEGPVGPTPPPVAGAVGAVLAGLDEEERRLLDAKYRRGLSVAEIARREGRSEKAVEGRLGRARERFRQRWRRESET